MSAEKPPKVPGKPFIKGKSGNPNGRPVTTDGIDRKVEKMMTEAEIIFEGDPLDYMAKHAEYLSRAGDHKRALELAKEIMPYRNSRMAQTAAQSEDKELVIRFEEPESK